MRSSAETKNHNPEYLRYYMPFEEATSTCQTELHLICSHAKVYKDIGDIKEYNEEIAKLDNLLPLLKEKKIDINAQNSQGKTALSMLVTCLQPAKWGVISKLLQAGADVNIPDNEGRSPLHRSLSNHIDVIKQLFVEGKAKISCPGDGDKGEGYYVWKGVLVSYKNHEFWGDYGRDKYVKCAKLFLEHGAFPPSALLKEPGAQEALEEMVGKNWKDDLLMTLARISQEEREKAREEREKVQKLEQQFASLQQRLAQLEAQIPAPVVPKATSSAADDTAASSLLRQRGNPVVSSGTSPSQVNAVTIPVEVSAHRVKS